MTEVVLVTGASGCLGQHIVKLLQEKDDSVKEIRCFDIVAYENNLEHEKKKPMKVIVGDVRNLEDLNEAFRGVTSVVHSAACVDTNLFPDEDKLEGVNVRGTKNVIEACIRNNVPKLIFTSTVDIMIDGEHIFYGMESTTVVPKKFSMGKYAETKAKAEELVLQASGKELADGTNKLRTVALRPSPFYGEEDNHFVTTMLRHAKKRGSVTRIHSLDERMQIAYVGNVAAAHLKAIERLAVDESISGEAFYITDDTPIIDLYENVRPYVEANNAKLSDYVLPYWLVWLTLFFVTLFLKVLRPLVKVNPKIPSPGMVSYICSTIFFNRSKATLRLNYQPIYSAEESQTRSIQYYSKLRVTAP